MMVFSRSAGEATRIGHLLVRVKAIEIDRVVFEIDVGDDARIEEHGESLIVRTPPDNTHTTGPQ
jgi:hypothetical protein